MGSMGEHACVHALQGMHFRVHGPEGGFEVLLVEGHSAEDPAQQAGLPDVAPHDVAPPQLLQPQPPRPCNLFDTQLSSVGSNML